MFFNTSFRSDSGLHSELLSVWVKTCLVKYHSVLCRVKKIYSEIMQFSYTQFPCKDTHSTPKFADVVTNLALQKGKTYPIHSFY